MQVTEMSPAQIRALRRRGVAAVAEAAGRRPGGFHKIDGGVVAIRSIVEAELPAGIHDREWWVKVLTAICWQESRGDQLAVSYTGALGPFQLTSFVYGADSGKGYRAINPFQWGPSLVRAYEEMYRLVQRAERGGMMYEEALERALAAYKEGWAGSQDPARRRRGYEYADNVIEIKELLI